MHEKRHYKISVAGCGNLAYRISIALKISGHTIDYIYGRDIAEAEKLSYILNKPETTGVSITSEDCKLSSHSPTKATDLLNDLAISEVVILAISDSAINGFSDSFFNSIKDVDYLPVVLHSSGATQADVLNKWPSYGVLYPLMTLSKTKPVDFKLIPFFLEASNPQVLEIMTNICYTLGSEYKVCSSEERLRVHTAAVFISNFVNYLTGLAFDISGQNQMFLMPLAIETVRKAFLYEHPSLVQTGPAVRDDHETMKKHLQMLSNMEDHKLVYETISRLILKQKNSR